MPLDYQVIFTSALAKTGLDQIEPILENNTSILCGASGVGKSSIINAILNTSRQRTLPVSDKTKKGVHTTRHCELIEVQKNAFIVDTPGFSHLKFDFLLPSEIKNLFVEMKDYDYVCKYKDCLHINEDGCSYKEIIINMDETRFESYKKFVTEAKEYEERISKESIKDERNTKFNQNKIMAKISHKKRTASRKTLKQNMYKDEIE